MSAYIGIPIVGLPLAGKATILEALSSVYSSELYDTRPMIEKGPFAGHPIVVLCLDVEIEESRYRFQAAPGGTPLEFSSQLLEGAERAVFVFDPQRACEDRQAELWRAVAPLLPPQSWYFIINKLDIVSREDAIAAFSGFLRDHGIPEDRPWVAVSAIEFAAQDALAEFFQLVTGGDDV